MSNVSKEDFQRIEGIATYHAESFKTGEWFETIRKEAGIYCAQIEHIHMKAENDRLKEEVDRLNESLEKFADGHDKLIEEAAALQSKIEKAKGLASRFGYRGAPLSKEILDLLK